mmetsp:Transcript_6848/g.6372  ORF Transcript_6848/g.6372 Transcript_6848/m.6372 type:complete len:314 (+) Transcript_6848:838-1779(+)|eukprot:CAMPEP_0197015132 /NCGR_PEP_ID=MMETSP1380-20130617/72962_1 /TAXON_ID=5936 /ORGANISM="Euplotes crassus, Strain CT5" /LENGTH=313 /DNA_ID=CAMNT_0042440829 /DNA_START=824 /DNA_END=1765 /DNA_ORIENTATION=+
MNVKFPAPKPKVPVQRNSFMALSRLQKAPPGFENTQPGNPHPKFSGFAMNQSKHHDFSRRNSPPSQELEQPVYKRPHAKRSHQNVVKPLVTGLDTKSDFYLYKDLNKEKLSSDSLSDDIKHDYIKEVENDDTEEEKYSTTSSTRPKLRMSSDHLKVNHKLSSNSFGSGSSVGQTHEGKLPMTLPDSEKPVEAIYEYKGQISNLAMTQQGSKYLQRVLTHAAPEMVEFIFQEVLDKLSALMPDQYGNYFSQKLFQSCSPHQRLEILKSISHDIHRISCSKSGTHSMQNLIDMINMEEEYQILEKALEGHILQMA